jgi:hypothetical protein
VSYLAENIVLKRELESLKNLNQKYLDGSFQSEQSTERNRIVLRMKHQKKEELKNNLHVTKKEEILKNKTKSKSPKSIKNTYLETIDERTSKENFNENFLKDYSKNINDAKNSTNISKVDEKILHSVSFDKLNNFSKDHSDISYIEESSRRQVGISWSKKLNPLKLSDRISNTLTNSHNSVKTTNKKNKTHKDLILPLVRKETKIDPIFLHNESQIMINEKKIIGLSESIFYFT